MAVLNTPGREKRRIERVNPNFIREQISEKEEITMRYGPTC